MLGQLTLVNKDKCDPARIPLVNKGRIVDITLTREGNPAGLKPTLVNKRINSSDIENFSAPAPHPTVDGSILYVAVESSPAKKLHFCQQIVIS